MIGRPSDHDKDTQTCVALQTILFRLPCRSAFCCQVACAPFGQAGASLCTLPRATIHCDLDTQVRTMQTNCAQGWRKWIVLLNRHVGNEQLLLPIRVQVGQIWFSPSDTTTKADLCQNGHMFAYCQHRNENIIPPRAKLTCISGTVMR